MVSFSVVDSTHASVHLYLPEGQWDYLRWLMSQGFDLNSFTKTCDQRRRTILEREISFTDFVSFATDRLHRLHYHRHEDDRNLVQPVFEHQIAQAIDKAESFFCQSGIAPMRWSGWRA